MLEHGELTTAVLRPRALVMPDDGRLLLTVALRLNAVRRNADRFEVGADRRGAEVAKREVVFVRATLVAVTLDDHDTARLLLEVRGHGFDLGHLARREGRGVEAEVDRREIDVRATRIVRILVKRRIADCVRQRRRVGVRRVNGGRYARIRRDVRARCQVALRGDIRRNGFIARAGRRLVIVLAARHRERERPANRNRLHHGTLHFLNSLVLN